jgi:hypothetical protein
MNITKISEKAMLSSLNMGGWDAKRSDKRAAREVADHHKVNQSRLAVRKEAIDTKAPSYQAVKQAMSEMRQAHYDLTLPWGRDGAQILTAVLFDNYCEKMRACQAKIRKAVAAFAEDFQALKSAAKRDLNGLYNESDYPTNIKAKFSCEFFITPIPDAEDFRVSLSEDAVDEVKRQIIESNQTMIAEAMKAPYERLYAAINRMVERLADPKGIFRDTLVSNVSELCQILPGLNLTNDPKLDDLRKRAERMIEGIDPQELRDDRKVRRSVANQARQIQDVMASFMGAPSVEEDAA